VAHLTLSGDAIGPIFPDGEPGSKIQKILKQKTQYFSFNFLFVDRYSKSTFQIIQQSYLQLAFNEVKLPFRWNLKANL